MKIAPLAPRRRLFALGTASALAIAATSPALAQDAAADDQDATDEVAEDSGETIIVTGFRASLESAQNIKRDSDTFVDAVTAEDIGALPDRSVAETLQRIPGITIGRFEKTTDPDRFSVEGTGVIIRGLPFARSELNGRDIFSATGGRELSFNDVSPELLGRVEVFKNVTADMIEGGPSGTVNLVTRKPLDKRGTHIAGTLEANYGDLRQEWSPGFSVLGSTTYENNAGSLGFQLSYAKSELLSRTDASQVADPCYRPASLNGPCIRAQSVGSGGFVGNPNFTAGNFPPDGAVLVPKGAGVRTTDLDRDREAWSAVVQYEDPTGNFIATFEWLRAEAGFQSEEFALISRVDDEGLFPVAAAGSTLQFDENGFFQKGILTQRPGDAYATPFGRGGIPLDSLRFVRDTKTTTQDFSFDVKWNITDRFRVNLEAQNISSDLSRDSVFGALSTFANVDLDLTGRVPQVNFLAPPGAPADYFTAGRDSYYWFGLDSREKNEGELQSLRFDAEYDISDTGFFRAARFGARWAERDRTTRNTNFSTWGNLSAVWAGRAGCAPWGEGSGCSPTAPGVLVYPDFDPGRRFPAQNTNGFVPGRYYTGLPGQEFAIAGGAFVDDFPNFAQYRTPFGDNFQRGGTAPIQNGGAFYFGGDDFLGEYLAGETDRQFEQIQNFGLSPERFNYGVNGRVRADAITGAPVPCDIEGVYCPGEVSVVTEVTKAAYARVDFGHDFGNGWNVDGNIGLRYVETEVQTQGRIGLPDPRRFDDPRNGFANGDGIVQVSEIAGACAAPPTPGVLRGFCSLSPARQAEFAAAHTGEEVIDNRDITFEHWLPSFNAKLDVGGGLLFRVAASKNISRPDLQLFRAGGGIGDNTNALQIAGAQALATGPLFALQTGNRNLLPVSVWNYDMSVEWYFDTVGSVTLSGFVKDVSGFIDNGFSLVDYEASVPLEIVIDGPVNSQDGILKGFELAYQQTYDFLPGFLSGLGTQLTYTYVDGSDFSNPRLTGVGAPSVTTGANRLNAGAFVAGQPLAGISKHSFNATVFYEKDWLSMRAAYNWRSEFLITPRDDIFPFSPIWQEDSGQLDASIFVTVMDGVKLGVQGVNLLDEITRTSQVVDFDGNRVTRSAFRNDRRYTFLARFDF
ncbi:TonB-dependent receptor plug domain-containing protein [Porphyrobacter sp. ULC335]|uniref:TonB-dependent receptor plug domain-containing protein n=1 Tax=Porphyrobacter sp. ULC335 TaxID=2854260 RepID=UPI00221F69F3|nr:TonB-dependent receptor plug domain-containing protein [Porphyrobacter sp. ULC335]UYV15214.1 TonB-dependent receptor plug domain-containing protein [Porphyrobacter sp. ULC335]